MGVLSRSLGWFAGAGRRLRSWLRDCLRREVLYRLERVDDEPTKPKPNILYVVEDGGRLWSALMACPDGCGQVLHMNLIPDTKPVWRLTEHADRTATLHPSVWRREGCGCHFNLRAGRVEWCD
jgi:Family of unknown function (DUF6527)